MNKIIHTCSIVFTAWMIVALVGCFKNNVSIRNDSQTYACSYRISSDGIVFLKLYDLKANKALPELDTGASCYHRFGFRWLSHTHILLKSSDIGYRIITVGDECKSHIALVNDNGDSVDMQAVDEEYKPVFTIKVGKPFLDWEGFMQ